MNRHRILGAVSFPAFLLMLSAALGMFVAELKSADAMIVRAPEWQHMSARALAIEPVQVDFADRRAWEAALSELQRNSPVMNGDWQPSAAAATPAPEAAPETPEPAADVLPVAEREVSAEADVAAAAAETAATTANTAPLLRKTPSGGVNVLAARKSVARLALQAGHFATAYQALRPGVTEARHDSEYLGLLALAALRTGNPAEALVLYQRLVALEPESPRWRAGAAYAGGRIGIGDGGGFRQAVSALDASGHPDQTPSAAGEDPPPDTSRRVT